MEPKDVLKLIEERNIEIVDLKFMDFLGSWQHCSYPVHELTEVSFEEGFGFDGSSIRGWTRIHESDMLVIPDPDTVFVDPFASIPTLHIIGDIYDPITKQPFSRDPRYIARKAENYLKYTGIADQAFFGAEAEFFVFSDVTFDLGENYAFYYLDSEEGFWNTGREENPNLDYKIRPKSGYFVTPPTDILFDLRNEMVKTLEECGISVEAHHHEVATGGQMEIDIKYSTLTKAADNIMTYKYIIKNMARNYDLTVTFMPKPIFGDNGCGMHTHQSLWKNGKPLFAGNRYAGLSELALYYIGGLLKHGPALAAICSPTINSFKRLVPGFEAPVNLAYSRRNRSAAIRIPMYSPKPRQKRIEYRPPDPTANPYLAFAAMLMAGIDGIENKIDPGPPLDKDIYDMEPEELKDVPKLPGSLEEALDALEKDHEFLLKGDVFTEDVIKMWIELKRKEITEYKLRPHPYEFLLYFNA
ncbi:type I glutamate--ammonia ligase [Candidatus Aminicenantes bacterium AC-335-A11]|nr:type I glutamate--ammonia ligase [SCandidatus Aminicenantes bacterium Aminicenantia_JdfR_composite]MCP2597103.1 type I glutamate--ammonia ligase [Candidatus Aminicenantes bacterium AC-335-G13]MCP2598729.1 type I glutamate--ammonia ligase [Candidatus Aminicenantes bacterium AC-335-L06]MCP2618761.1 type I glutamate--ammonia ligase [Candidatus Aminicenantes bacterium AC-335-A11]